MSKVQFIPNLSKEILLFPSRIDEDIADDAPVRIIPNRSLEKVSCHFLMTAIRKIALYMLDS